MSAPPDEQLTDTAMHVAGELFGAAAHRAEIGDIAGALFLGAYGDQMALLHRGINRLMPFLNGQDTLLSALKKCPPGVAKQAVGDLRRSGFLDPDDAAALTGWRRM